MPTAEACEAALLREAERRASVLPPSPEQPAPLTREQRMIGVLMHTQGIRLSVSRSRDGRGLTIRFTTRPALHGSRHRRAPSRRPTHRRGSRRSASSDPDDGDPEPPGLRLWRHTRFGSCSPGMLRVLIEGAAR
jgi:hypothetical protein